MKRRTLFSFLTVAALGLLTAGPAYAGTFTWKSDATTDAFRTPGNWDVSGPHSSDYPSVNDKAIIQATTGDGQDPIIDDQDETISELDIQNGGLLTITGKTLTLGGTAQHDIVGDLVLSNNTAVLKFADSVTVSGAGNIIGEHNDAVIEIADNKTLTNQMVIKGKMTIKESGSSGTFLNGSTGKVWANVAGTLRLEAGLTLSNCSTAVWAASGHGDARLRFNEDATGLTGLFYLDDCAEIEVADGVNIATTNTLTDGAGSTPQGCVLVGVSGASFSYRDRCDGNKTTLNENTPFGMCSCP